MIRFIISDPVILCVPTALLRSASIRYIADEPHLDPHFSAPADDEWESMYLNNRSTLSFLPYRNRTPHSRSCFCIDQSMSTSSNRLVRSRSDRSVTDTMGLVSLHRTCLFRTNFFRKSFSSLARRYASKS